ncbi:MAG TPA: hypothetical protein VH210_05765 [Gaiellaceae bacterium]|jgi:hypothetical protein|nr:hypothetical protein [Gaiellaceae bacterium]
MEENYGMATGAYVEERDDWLPAVERARGERWRFLELTAIVEPLLATLEPFFVEHRAQLNGFERVSLHAPIRFDSAAATTETIVNLPLEGDVIFHPDTWAEERGALERLGPRVVFENMDVAKPFGRSVDDLRSVFTEHPDAGFCLDVAHVWTNDNSLRLGHDLIDEFDVRLRQLHVSGIEPDGTHRTTTRRDLELYRPLLERCAGVPWILEAVVET